ncbi:unnamed protein product [Brugia pahangi]|uniref:Transcriptional regulator n=1 Tax=Brugia pahangi TaxID=6280 RepID=A0A0N4TGS6_BRUPA|nr:unnamed protein product [Brugia pahangi]
MNIFVKLIISAYHEVSFVTENVIVLILRTKQTAIPHHITLIKN